MRRVFSLFSVWLFSCRTKMAVHYGQFFTGLSSPVAAAVMQLQTVTDKGGPRRSGCGRFVSGLGFFLFFTCCHCY